MDLFIYNNTQSEKVYDGATYPVDQYTQIPDAVLSESKQNELIITGIVSGDINLSIDGATKITDINKQINYLKDSIEVETDTKGRPLSAMMKPSGLSDGTLVTHDLCDKTTWYQESTEHTAVGLSDVSGLTYRNLSHTHWIDLTHGKLYGEDNVDNLRVPKVYVDAVEVTTGFTIDYSEGVVTFESAPSGSVTADFWKAGSSVFSVIPSSGKILALEHAELQFAEDVIMSTPIRFEIWVYNPYYGVSGHPYELMVKIPYKTIRYKNIKDIINACNLGQSYIPKISGLQQNILVFPFNYVATKPLASSVGAELRVSIEGDVELGGEWATATFYFLSEDE